MIIKCKMCGGDIEFTPGATYGTCEYCGSTSTIPKADDEGKLNRYNRANHFRRQCEFDKAVAAYEKILEQDDTDAEAHWGTVISRYGIEYVEDPATKKRIPTCHRVQMTSILADEDYKAAVEYAPDAESRRLYEEEAARIAEIQKGILAISQHEKPYDVFICYKETDDNGQRTHDSQWAQDVYYGLTEQGYKVFFSRITLEDKLGQEYEPYIFAALQSAQVMVVIGSKPEYFNAVWVKNEWSRYLALMKTDRKRLLIPCYRGMDPYDLPDELSALQSQDMSKIGFMQDLIRGVRKVMDAEKKTEQSKAAAQLAQPAAAAGVAPGISSLMDRTYLFMEDGDFDNAAEYLNRVLDIDPKHAPAYVAKVCVALHIRKEAELRNALDIFENSNDWQKAIRFADQSQKQLYESYIQSAVLFREETRKQGIYNEALYLVNSATSSGQCLTAARKFRSIHGFKDAAQQEETAISKGKRIMYDEASCILRNANRVQDCQNARRIFASIQGFLDADEQISACDNKAATIINNEKKTEIERAKQKEKKTKKKITIGAITVIVIIAIVLYVGIIKPMLTYNSAISKLEAKKYGEAITTLVSLNGYRDCNDKIKKAKALAYNDGTTAINNHQYLHGMRLLLIAIDQGDAYSICINAFDQLNVSEAQCIMSEAIQYSNGEFYENDQSAYANLWREFVGKYIVGNWTTTRHTVCTERWETESKASSTVTVSLNNETISFYCADGFDASWRQKTLYEISLSKLTAERADMITAKGGNVSETYNMSGRLTIDVLSNTISMNVTKGNSPLDGEAGNFSLRMTRN